MQPAALVALLAVVAPGPATPRARVAARADSSPMVRACPPFVSRYQGPEGYRWVVRQNVAQVRACYDRALRWRPYLAGSLVLRIAVGAAGRIVAIAVVDDTLRASEVSECVVDAARQWLFPDPADAAAAVLNFPFTFVPPRPRAAGR